MSRVAAPLADPSLADGRRRRGQDNRDRIVAAMVELVRAGEISPSAEQVAARADVGLRTVFRHFQDMDGLYREMARTIEVELRTIIDPPLQAGDWRARIADMIDRRSQAFEKITPFRRAAEAFQHRSKFLGSDNNRLVVELRERLRRELPPEIAADRDLFEALDLMMSFEAWRRLRQDQGLDVEAARQVMSAAVARLVR